MIFRRELGPVNVTSLVERKTRFAVLFRNGETIIGLYKSEVIERQGPWPNRLAVEKATMEWVHWFSSRRLFGPIGDIPPAEAETLFYASLEENGSAA